MTGFWTQAAVFFTGPNGKEFHLLRVFGAVGVFDLLLALAIILAFRLHAAFLLLVFAVIGGFLFAMTNIFAAYDNLPWPGLS